MWMVVWGLVFLLRNCISNAQPVSEVDPAWPMMPSNSPVQRCTTLASSRYQHDVGVVALRTVVGATAYLLEVEMLVLTVPVVLQHEMT